MASKCELARERDWEYQHNRRTDEAIEDYERAELAAERAREDLHGWRARVRDGRAR